MSLEIPSQSKDIKEPNQYHFAGRKLSARACSTPEKSADRQAQIAELEIAFATGQITLEGLSITTDLL